MTSGQSVTFSVIATGTGPLQYQWLRNGAALAGANASSYTLPSVKVADSGAAFAVSVTNPGGTVQSPSALLTVNPIVPSLTLAPVANKTFGTSPFSVTATSNSAGAITYGVVSGPATVNGASVSLTGAGTVVLSATQAAEGEYAAATVTTTFAVAPGTPALAFAPIPAETFGDAAFPVSAHSASTGQVTYAVVSGPATVSGSVVTLTGAGTVVLSAAQAADPNYLPATATASFTVAPGKPSLTFAAVPAKTFGDPAFTITASSASTGAVSYSVTSGPATLSGSTVTLTGAGTVVLSATQAADANYTAATASISLPVSQAKPVLAFSAIPAKTFGDAAFPVTATSASTGQVTYAVVSGPATVSGSTVTLTGAGTVVLSASQAADSNYAATAATATLSVAPARPSLAFATIPGKTFGDTAFAVTASSASTGAVTYAVVSGPATVSGSIVTLTGAGTVVLSASQAADSNYVAASATVSFTVSPGTPSLSFAAVPAKTYGDAAFTVSAKSASTGAVTYAVVSGPATVSGATVTITGAGTVVLSASQAADSNYAAATTTTSFTVAPAPATTASLSSSSFDFGQTLVGSPATKPVVTVTNTGAQLLYLSPSLAGDPGYSVATPGGCGATLAAGASCAVSVVYAPTASSGGAAQTATLSLNFENATGPGTVALTGVSGVLAGTVTNT
ncbi:MAG TPA: hypothetical protein VKV02_14840, partial [Acidobacteriaceae bacterium]|nr:hypothetical protein [Acidobacteriaceae bacterium]